MAHNFDRKLVRLQGFSYSTPKKYFITFCTKYRVPFFGSIINNQSVLSELGLIANDCWRDIPNHHKNVRLDAFIVMPDHIHGIIELLPIRAPSIPVGAIHGLPRQELNNRLS